MSGPLPKAESDRRRRNAATIPTTRLPAAGRSGAAPRPPAWVTLGKSGKAWWAWAWKTPQAAGWAKGHEPFVARRASLEDDLAALEVVDNLDFAEFLEIDPSDRSRFLEATFRRLAALASGKLNLFKEARELDNRLGLNPKAMADLRWTIVAAIPEPVPEAEPDGDPKVSSLDDRRRRLAGAS
jgi:hypothetical protein